MSHPNTCDGEPCDCPTCDTGPDLCSHCGRRPDPALIGEALALCLCCAHPRLGRVIHHIEARGLEDYLTTRTTFLKEHA